MCRRSHFAGLLLVPLLSCTLAAQSAPPIEPVVPYVANQSEPGINYYWRVLTSSPSGWVSSKEERFEVPVCPFDPVDPGRFGDTNKPNAETDDTDGGE